MTDAKKADSSVSTSMQNSSADVTRHTNGSTETAQSPQKNKQEQMSKAQGTKSSPQTNNKTAKLALLLSLLILFIGVGAGYYFWQQQHQIAVSLAQTEQQLNQVSQQIEQQINQQSQQAKQQIASALAAQQNQVEQLAEQLNRVSETQQQLAELTTQQPSDWLVSEVQYLLRLAARSLWLEQQPQTTITLLTEANNRLKQLTDARYLSIRQAIADDVASLNALPTTDKEQLLIDLMTLQQTVPTLPLKDRVKTAKAEPTAALSADIQDWRQNLATVWRHFSEMFLTISYQDTPVEPVIAQEQQQLVREHLALKLQLAQWAITQGQQAVYQQTLEQAITWCQRYFDNQSLTTQQFLAKLQQLSQQTIHVVMPENLKALSALQQLLDQQNVLLEPTKTPATAVATEGSL
jgi:uroporphyrin-3 C-methyltransferase